MPDADRVKPRLTKQRTFLPGTTSLAPENAAGDAGGDRSHRLLLTNLPVFQAKNSETPRQRDDAVAVSRAKTLLAEVASSDSALPVAWNAVLKNKGVSNDTLAAAFEILHNTQQYDSCVEGLLAAIRNDHAQPWMYDVLAIEMQLAGRAQKEINRVLLSRVDFSDGDEAQLLLTASMLSRFNAFSQAIKVCREAVKRNPWQTATWVMAARIADRSGDADAIVWSRTGILKYDWTEGHEQSHAAANAVLMDLEQELRRTGKTAEADSVRSSRETALIRDLRISIAWTGDADLDLVVREPGNHTCSYKSRLTPNGGVLMRQSDGGKGATRRGPQREEYVCVEAPAGDYEVSVKNILGRLIIGKVLIRVTRHEGTEQERTESRFIEIGDSESAIRVPLKAGRGPISPQ